MILPSLKNWPKIILVSLLVFSIFFILNNTVFAQADLLFDPNSLNRDASLNEAVNSSGTYDNQDNFFACDTWFPSFGCMFLTIGYGVGLIASALFALGGFLIGWALELNFHVLNLSIVHKGWTYTRDLANLGFVLSILVISFGIIIRSEEYGSMKLLKNLIVAAILVNFSLVIAGVILDFANILTTFFANIGLAKGTGFLEFTEKIAQITQIDTFSKEDSNAGSLLLNGSTSLVAQILSIFFLVLFTVLAAIVFMGLAVMLLTRFIWIAILLIVMPLAFLGSIFPKTQGVSKQWWQKFMEWTLFPITAMFFLSLAVNSLLDDGKENISFINGSPESLSTMANAGNLLESSTILDGGIDNIVTMLVVLGFLTASITFGFAASIGTAKFAGKWAEGVKKWSINKARRGAVRATKATGRFALNKAGVTEDNINKLAETGAKSKYSLIRKLTAGTAIGASAASKAVSRTELDIRKKEFKDVNKDNIANYYNATDAQGRAALMEIAGEKGWTNKLPSLDYKAFNKFGGDKKKFSEKDILLSEDKEDHKNVFKSLQTADPGDRLKAFTTSITEKIRSMKPEDFSKVQWSDVLEGKNIRKMAGVNITEEEWKSIYQPEILKAISENTYGKEFGNILKKSSAGERNEIANKTLATALKMSEKDIDKALSGKPSDADYQTYIPGTEPIYEKADIKRANLFDHLTPEQKKELKEKNRSLYDYFKNSLHSSGGDDGSDEKGDKKEDSEDKKDSSKSNEESAKK